MSDRTESPQSTEVRIHFLFLTIGWSGLSAVLGLYKAFDILEAGTEDPTSAFFVGLQTTVLILAMGALPLLLLHYRLRKGRLTHS